MELWPQPVAAMAFLQGHFSAKKTQALRCHSVAVDVVLSVWTVRDKIRQILDKHTQNCNDSSSSLGSSLRQGHENDNYEDGLNELPLAVTQHTNDIAWVQTGLLA